MARRRRTKKRSGAESLVALLTLGLIVLAILWVTVAAFARANPVGAMKLLALLALALAVSSGVFVWWRVRSRSRFLARARTLNDLLLLTPTQFEYAVMELLRAWGYREVRHTGGGGDLAADLTCRTPDGSDRVVVQCKRYAPGKAVGSPEVQLFIGMLTVHHRAQVGIFVTTSSYTRPALALAQQHNLRMIDGAQLAAYLQQAQAQRQRSA